MTVFVYDTLTEAADTTFASHAADIGGTWQYYTQLNSALVKGGLGYVTGGSQGFFYNPAVPPSADYSVEYDFIRPLGTYPYPGILARLTLVGGTPTKNGYSFRHDSNNNKLQIVKMVNGVDTAIGTEAAQSLTAGQTYRFKIVVEGSTIKGYLDGVEKCSATDATHAAAGFAGLTQADGRIDNFVASTLSSGSNPAPIFLGPNIGNQSTAAMAPATTLSVSARFYDTDALTFTPVGSWPSGVALSSAGLITVAPTVAGVYANLKVRAMDTIGQTADSDIFTWTVLEPTKRKITVSAVKNASGQLQLGKSGIVAIVNDMTTGALVVRKVALTSHAVTGDLLVEDAAMTTGVTYSVRVILADGSEGTWNYTAVT